MTKHFFKLSFFLLFLNQLTVKGQFFEIYQPVNIEKYQGKNFIVEAKIYYADNITNSSWALLAVRSVSAEVKQIKQVLYNDNAGVYYKKGEWSHYELRGPIDKKAKYLSVGVAIAGSSNYYVDDLKLFVMEGKNKVEVPLINSDFEDGSLNDWKNLGMDKNTKLSLSNDRSFSGKQSLLVDNSSLQTVPTFGNNKNAGKYMEVNGVKLYYEVYGKGEPLLLLHGNNASMGSFNKQLKALSEHFTVVALDSRGQGKSTSNDTKITYELMAGDVNTFLENMNLKKVNILGWSDGGNIAVILGMEHPDKVNKMAIMGTVLYNNESSVTAETNKLIRKQVKEMDATGVSKTSMDYRLKILLLTEPNINPEALQKIQAPTLVMAGEHDVVKEKHTKLIADKIPKSKLLIFKGADHEAPDKIAPIFNNAVLDFFLKQIN